MYTHTVTSSVPTGHVQCPTQGGGWGAVTYTVVLRVSAAGRSHHSEAVIHARLHVLHVHDSIRLRL